MMNLIKMAAYQLLHHRLFWCGLAGVMALVFLTASTYLSEVMPSGGVATSLAEIFNGMVYDSTFLLILLSSLLALMLGQEFSQRTIDLEIFAGHSRKQIFWSKVSVYLLVFNMLALVFPAIGCMKQLSYFGGFGELFFAQIAPAVVYSILLNSAMFFVATSCCFCLRSAAKAMGATALTTFVLSLYLGYGMMLKWPMAFLPLYQIRAVIIEGSIFNGQAILVGLSWIVLLAVLSWRSFDKTDLK
ncbi:MAG: ABC transporter permease [Peptococcaceae bacterium]|nr:ABC transporter permease [Peptococcaceae bacterium]